MSLHLECFLRRLRQTLAAADSSRTDAELLARFLRERDEEAFAALVARHGPMVLRTCRRMLSNAHSAEDVFQATFLVLARKAVAVRPPDRLAAWLFGVARHLAWKSLRTDARRLRRARETAAAVRASADPQEAASAAELLQTLEEEIHRLPERYRLPMILCSLEGKSQEEAARQLGWSADSVRGRLERGRVRLHARLTRGGLLPAAVLAALEASRLHGASVPAPLMQTTVRAAVLFVAGTPTLPAGIAPRILELAKAGFPSASLSGHFLLSALAAGVLLAGTGVAALGLLSGPQRRIVPAAARAEEPPNPGKPGAPPAPVRKDLLGDPPPSGAIARFVSVRLPKHGEIGRVNSVDLSPDGKLTVTASQDHTLRLWETASGREVRRLPLDVKDGGAAAFTPDGKKLPEEASSASPSPRMANFSHRWGSTARSVSGTPRRGGNDTASEKGSRLTVSGPRPSRRMASSWPPAGWMGRSFSARRRQAELSRRSADITDWSCL